MPSMVRYLSMVGVLQLNDFLGSAHSVILCGLSKDVLLVMLISLVAFPVDASSIHQYQTITHFPCIDSYLLSFTVRSKSGTRSLPFSIASVSFVVTAKTLKPQLIARTQIVNAWVPTIFIEHSYHFRNTCFLVLLI